MTAADFQSTWVIAAAQTMAMMGQPTTWNNTPISAIVDGLSYSTELRVKGGGLVEDFAGSVVYLKSSFAPAVLPKVGQKITIPSYMGRPARVVEIKAINGLLDRDDPFLTCLYEPVVKS